MQMYGSQKRIAQLPDLATAPPPPHRLPPGQISLLFSPPAALGRMGQRKLVRLCKLRKAPIYEMRRSPLLWDDTEETEQQMAVPPARIWPMGVEGAEPLAGLPVRDIMLVMLPRLLIMVMELLCEDDSLDACTCIFSVQSFSELN